MSSEKCLSAEMIAECRKQLSLRGENLKTLSTKTGISYGYIRLIMSGQRCSETAKTKICNHLGINTDESKAG
jgi:hypothetical protein